MIRESYPFIAPNRCHSATTYRCCRRGLALRSLRYPFQLLEARSYSGRPLTAGARPSHVGVNMSRAHRQERNVIFSDPFRIKSLIAQLTGVLGDMVKADSGLQRMIRPVYFRQRTVPRFQRLTCSVAFNYPGYDLTHMEVKSTVESKLRDVGVKRRYRIKRLQFIPLSVQLNAKGMDNRWVMQFDCEEPQQYLIRLGVQFKGHYVTVRDYEDVQRVEIALWKLVHGNGENGESGDEDDSNKKKRFEQLRDLLHHC